jgi:hypothetical protein
MPAASPAQQHLMGMALRAKRTGKPASPEVERVAQAMTARKLHEMAQKPRGGYQHKR